MKVFTTFWDDEKESWVLTVECHLCKKEIPTKEASITTIDCEYFGAIGFMYVKVCKECDRDKKLNELEI